MQKTNSAYHVATKELVETKEKLTKVSHLDEVAMGSEERQELEANIEELEDKVDALCNYKMCMHTRRRRKTWETTLHSIYIVMGYIYYIHV